MPAPTIEEFLTAEKRKNPNYALPRGYRWDGTRVTKGAGVVLGNSPGAGGQSSGGGINIPLGNSESAGPGYVDGIMGGVLPGSSTGMPTPPQTPSNGGATVPGSSGLTDGIMNFLGNTDWGSLLDVFGDAGSVLGSQAAGASMGRDREADMLSRRDLAENQQYGIEQNAQMQAGNLDLNRQDFANRQRGSVARQAMTGNLLSNMKDVDFNVPGVKSTNVGGLRPSALGAGGRANAAELAKQATLKQLDPQAFSGGEVLTPPTLSEIPDASGWETAAGAGGGILQILGALSPLLGGRGRQPSTTPPKTVGG